MSDQIIVELDNSTAAKTYATNAISAATLAVSSATSALASATSAAESAESANTVAAGVQEILQSDKTYTTAINQLSLEESTGYGVISGLSTTVIGMTATVAAGIIHMANGNRYTPAQTTLTISMADATNPRIDLIYVSSTGIVTYLVGTPSVNPICPNVSIDSFSLSIIMVPSMAAVITNANITDLRTFKTNIISGLIKVSGNVSLGRCFFQTGSKLVLAAGSTITITKIIDTTDQIFDDSAGGSVFVLQSWVRPDWWGDIQNSILKSINSLPIEGGMIKLLNKRYKPNATTYDTAYMSRDNIFISGAKMPKYSYDLTKLEDGSIIEGKFNVFANNFGHENVGYDCGKYVVDTYFEGLDTHTANFPTGGTWDAFAFAQPNMSAPLPEKHNFYAKNIIGLCRDSMSVGHAVLQEAFDGGVIDNIVGVYGTHGVVIKSSNVSFGTIRTYATSGNGLIIKSDSYANCTNIIGDNHIYKRVPPNSSPWSVPAASIALNINAATANLNNIQISKVFSQGSNVTVNIAGSNICTDVQIGEIYSDFDENYTSDLTSYAVNSVGDNRRIQIGGILVNNSRYIINCDNVIDPEIFLQIGDISATNITGYSIQVKNTAIVNINNIEFKNCPYAYLIDNTAKLSIGHERFATGAIKWGSNPPALSSGWDNFGGGNSLFDIEMRGGAACLTGLIQRSTGLATSIATLPQYLKPLTNKRFIVYGNSKGIQNFVLLNIDATTGIISVNDGANTTNCDSYLSVDGCSWPIV